MGFNNVLAAFDEIGRVSSRLKKEEIFTKLIRKEEKLVKEILTITFNPFDNYFVRLKEKQYPKVKDAQYKDASADSWWHLLKGVLIRARDGKLRGNDLKRDIQEVVRTRPQYAYWLMRIVNRDLKMGLSDRTIEKVLPGLIPTADRQLCGTLDLASEVFDDSNEETASYPFEGWYWEPKYDGLRATAIVKDRKITILSRKGKPVWNCEHIIAEIKQLGVNNVALDGEFYAGSWNDSVGIAHTKATHEQKKKLKFFIFDFIPLKEWESKEGRTRLVERKLLLKSAFKGKTYKHIVLGPWSKIKYPQSMVKGYAKKVIRQLLEEAIEKGFEGIVVKNPKSKYRFRRSKDWLKLKPYYEDDFKITGWKEGTGKHQGKVGALTIKGKTTFRDKTYKIKCSVGSGIPDKERERLMHLAKISKLEGCTVQMEYIEVSMKEDERGYHALKNPVFMRLRIDKQ